MFAGLDVLDENPYSKTGTPVPEIQMSLIGNEDFIKDTDVLSKNSIKNVDKMHESYHLSVSSKMLMINISNKSQLKKTNSFIPEWK